MSVFTCHVGILFYLSILYFQYQNQVTVFIVGHTALCEQKLNLISQLNEVYTIFSG